MLNLRPPAFNTLCCFLRFQCNCIGIWFKRTKAVTGCGFNWQALLVEDAFPSWLPVIGYANRYKRRPSPHGYIESRPPLKPKKVCTISCMHSHSKGGAMKSFLIDNLSTWQHTDESWFQHIRQFLYSKSRASASLLKLTGLQNNPGQRGTDTGFHWVLSGF